MNLVDRDIMHCIMETTNKKILEEKVQKIIDEMKFYAECGYCGYRLYNREYDDQVLDYLKDLGYSIQDTDGGVFVSWA